MSEVRKEKPVKQPSKQLISYQRIINGLKVVVEATNLKEASKLFKKLEIK